MRDILQRGLLGKALSGLTPADRVAAAWPVAAGHAIAQRTSVIAVEGTTVTVQVPDAAWQQQLIALRGRLLADLAAASRCKLTDILFTVPQESRRTPPKQ